MFLYHAEVHIIPFSVLITNRISNSYFTSINDYLQMPTTRQMLEVVNSKEQ